MEDRLDQARKCAWYVEARRTRSAKENPAMGTAIAIRARHRDSNVCKTLLLTCAHLVKSSTGGYGKGELRREVLCWRPQFGYVPYADTDPWPEREHDGIYAATVWDVMARSSTEDWSEQQCRDAADWVLLEVLEPSFQDMDFLKVSPAEPRGKSLTIIGYPDGSKNWQKSSLVDSVLSSGFRVDRREIVPGIMRLDAGEGAAPGMSGGAVLDHYGDLVGLYRGQSPTHLSKVSIQLRTICACLHEQGWDCLVETERRQPTGKLALGLGGGLAAVLILALAIILWPRIPMAKPLSDVEKVNPEILLEPAGQTIPAEAERVEITDKHRYDKTQQLLEQAVYKVPEGQELVITEIQHTGPDAELAVIAKGELWPLHKLQATNSSPATLNIVAPSDTDLVLRAADSGVIQFRAKGYLRGSTAYLQTVVHVRASLLSPETAESFGWTDLPLAQCEITAQPVGFDPKKISADKTDDSGVTKLTIDHAIDLKQVRVYFQVVNVPERFAALKPLLPLKLGIVSVGSVLHYPFPKPAELVVGKEQERELQVIPYSLFDKFNRPLVASVLAQPSEYTSTAAGSDSGDVLGAPDGPEKSEASLEMMSSFIGVAPQFVEATLQSWNSEVTETRPVIDVTKLLDSSSENSSVRNWGRLKDMAGKIGPAVCLVRSGESRPEENPTAAAIEFGVGFLVAKDTVFCTATFDLSGGAAVSFANRPLDDPPEFKPIQEVLFQSGNYAIVHVPGAPDVRLPVRGQLLNLEAPDIVVFGYPVRDIRLPEQAQIVLSDVNHPIKSLMPGALTPAPAVPSPQGYLYIGHDASTSMGTAGGPIVDLARGEVIGIHCGGVWKDGLKANFGILMSEFLARDEVMQLLETRGSRVVSLALAVQGARPASGYQAEFLPGLNIPMPTSNNQETQWSEPLDYEHFSIIVNRNRALPALTAANLDRSSLQEFASAGELKVDSRLPVFEQLGQEFYNDSGLLSSPIIGSDWVGWGDNDQATGAITDVQSTTNASPMHPDFQRNAWQALQLYVRDQMAPTAKRISVFAGPVLANDDPVYRGRQIPKAYWAVAVATDPGTPGKPLIEAWIIQQWDTTLSIPVQKHWKDDVLSATRVKIEAVEQAAQLQFPDILH